MTQSVFASYMGVSVKTVEAWESGRTHPTGSVFRLLDILSTSDEKEYIVVKIGSCNVGRSGQKFH